MANKYAILTDYTARVNIPFELSTCEAESFELAVKEAEQALSNEVYSVSLLQCIGTSDDGDVYCMIGVHHNGEWHEAEYMYSCDYVYVCIGGEWYMRDITDAERADADALNGIAEFMPISEMYESLETGDYGDRLNDYRDSDAYICDAISEIADNATSIYYSDILDFIRRNPEALADVVSEGLYMVAPECPYDLYKHAQWAEYMTIEHDIYDHLADSIVLTAFDFLRYDLKLSTISADLACAITEWAHEIDNNDRMNDITDRIREYLGIE